eukprot:1141265-Rhodomonas_salina.1
MPAARRPTVPGRLGRGGSTRNPTTTRSKLRTRSRDTAAATTVPSHGPPNLKLPVARQWQCQCNETHPN